MKLCWGCYISSKMYCLSSVCFMCLNDKDIVNYIILQHTENEIVQQVKFVLPEIVIVEADLQLPVCSACCKALSTFQNFKKICLDNSCRYNDYIHKLQGPSEGFRQKFGELEVKIGENNLLSNIEQLEAVENLIVIKEEEFSVLEDYTGPFYQEILKKETETSNLQECDENINCADHLIKNEIQRQEFRINENKLTNLKQGVNIISSMEKLDESIDPLVYQQILIKERKPKNAQNCGTTIFKCSVCNKVFAYKSWFIAHMKTVHRGRKEHKCSICNKLFKTQQFLQCHMSVHTGVKGYKCSVCNTLFKSKHHLQYHILTQTGVKDYKCSVCKIMFKTQPSLQRHMSIHTGVKDYKCYVCNTKFRLKHYLQSHMSVHTGIKDYKCSVCNKLFTRKSSLQRHILVTHIRVKEFQCFLCNKKFALKQYLTSHMRLHEISKKRAKRGEKKVKQKCIRSIKVF